MGLGVLCVSVVLFLFVCFCQLEAFSCVNVKTHLWDSFLISHILPRLGTFPEPLPYLHSANSMFGGYCLFIARALILLEVLVSDHYLVMYSLL